MSSWLSYLNPYSYGAKPTTETPPPSSPSSKPLSPPTTSGVGEGKSTLRSAVPHEPSRLQFIKDVWTYTQSTTAYKWISPPFIWLWDIGCQIFWAGWEIAFPPKSSTSRVGPPSTPPRSSTTGAKDLTPKSHRSDKK
jgi:hypothetical protein